MSIRVGIVGISGFGGGEAMRLVASHPSFELTYAAGEGSAGSRLVDRFPGVPAKLAELMITLRLEQKLSKEEIFEDYANQVYLGWRGSFRIRGFGEASEAYLGKDLSQITLPPLPGSDGMNRATIGSDQPAVRSPASPGCGGRSRMPSAASVS